MQKELKETVEIMRELLSEIKGMRQDLVDGLKDMDHNLREMKVAIHKLIGG